MAYINHEKYETLVYRVDGPGPMFRNLVEQQWSSWLEFVAKAPWLQHWRHSDCMNKCGITPSGLAAKPTYGTVTVASSDTPRQHKITVDVSAIAHTIYSDAVWGFAVEHWLKPPCTNGPAIMQRLIIQHKNFTTQSKTVNVLNFWDQQFYNQTGIMIPIEFGDFDRWLEALWQKLL